MNGHPETETLSAFLDGEAPEVEGHVTTCASCRRQLDTLARVRTAVGTPVSPPDQRQKDAAIAAAVAAVSAPREDIRSRRLRVVAAAGGVAAAVLIGIAVSRVSTSHTSSKTASAPVSKHLVRGGDLGDVSDELTLRDFVQPALSGNGQVSHGTAGGGSAGAADASGGFAGPAGESNGTAAPAPRAVRTRPAYRPSPPPKCEAEARKLQPAGAELVYEATARWQGTPADVFGFSPPGAPATTVPGRGTPTRVYVLARSDCHLLVFQSYAP